MLNNPMRDEADRIAAEAHRRRQSIAAQGDDLEQFRFPGEFEPVAELVARAAAYRKAEAAGRIKYFNQA